MREEEYTELHIHPSDAAKVEVVAYQRKDGGWDVYIFEPNGSVPELEHLRTDENHIFIRRIGGPEEFDAVAKSIDQQLGDGYISKAFYREKGTRRTIDKIYDSLSKGGARGMSVQSCGPNEWELSIRRKDWEHATKIALSNIDRGEV